MTTSAPRVAIIHDWLTLTGGAERVLEQLLDLYPGSDLFCMVCFLEGDDLRFLRGRTPHTSFIQRLPFARRHYRSYLPLMPIAVEQFDLAGYDLVISSSHAVAKGVITGPDQVHVSYVYSPIRYAWDLQNAYLREKGITRGIRSVLARIMLHYLRLWDVRTASGVDLFIGISHFIARRIRKVYGRQSIVVYPPVDVDRFQLHEEKEDYYITASRMVPYKRMPLIAEAFSRMPERRLVIVGDGPEMPLVRAAAGPNVEVRGRLSDAEVSGLMQRARAFVFAAEEDFGIVPLEAQACGTPVIAYARGGSLETIRGEEDDPERTGLFFTEQTVEALIAAVERFEALERVDPAACRRNAQRFATDRFQRELRAAIEERMLDARRIGQALR